MCVRSRPSFKAIMNYISRDIITQESWTNTPWFKFYRHFSPRVTAVSVAAFSWDGERKYFTKHIRRCYANTGNCAVVGNCSSLKAAFILHPLALLSRYLREQPASALSCLISGELIESGSKWTERFCARPFWQGPCHSTGPSNVLYPPMHSLRFKKGFVKIILVPVLYRLLNLF